ncbi:hypothetical protein AtDm6_1885 [Acetobacter tropicalis]|uniref:Uncharacterized protein n=1 Tax=Acetobacter tropicalis TaxID=104102 RepID=A0A094ZKS2_9PROT|nr:hypothetical protein AtDm6_1885 [Acetobacter tropicalis]
MHDAAGGEPDPANTGGGTGAKEERANSLHPWKPLLPPSSSG